MGRTTNFGLSTFGPEGRISDDGYKFSLKDPQLIDALIYTLMNHDHRATSTGALANPAASAYPSLTLASTGGSLSAGTDYYYKFSYLDANGNETAASVGGFMSTPNPISAPATQVLTTATTGGSLVSGTYKYALAFYQSSGGVTTAPNISTIVVPTGTSTNTVTVPLPTIPDDATGWRIYRKGPGDLEYWLLDTQAAPASSYVDDGSVSPDCTKKRPTANTTNNTNKITVAIPASELPLDSRVTSWRIYRTSTAGSYGYKSLVATVVDTTTEGGADLVTSYVDTGVALSVGTPLAQTATPPSIPQLDAGDVFGSDSARLPSANAPLGVHAFNMLLPGTLAAQDYNQFFIPHDIPVERIDAFFLTAPTGLSGSAYLTLRFSDDALVDEVQALYNDAITQNEIQYISNTATSGTFTMSFDGQGPTAATDYNATAAIIKTRLESLSNINTVIVSGAGTPANPWVVEFDDPGSSDVAMITTNDTGLTGGTSTITESIKGSNGGTFTLSDGTSTTSAIAYNASAATVETRLQTDITAFTDVNVTGTGTETDPWIIVFVNPGDQDVDMLIVSDTSLNGSSTITELVKGHGNIVVDLVIDQNQQYHYYQTSLTDFGELEAETAPAVGGSQVSDTLATNDVAMELDTQNERNYWQVDGLEAGTYDFRFWAADPSQGATFSIRVNELTSETQTLYNNSTTGTFTITFDSAETGDIAYNASAAVVEAALETLSTINACTVTGSGTVGTPWSIVFNNPAGNVGQITTDDTGMDGTSTIATTVAGTSTNLEQLSITDNRPVYTPAFELRTTLDGTEIIELEVEKTDATANVVRVDKYEYEVLLPTLTGGQTVTVEILVTGSPTTNGSDLQTTLWY